MEMMSKVRQVIKYCKIYLQIEVSKKATSVYSHSDKHVTIESSIEHVHIAESFTTPTPCDECFECSSPIVRYVAPCSVLNVIHPRQHMHAFRGMCSDDNEPRHRQQ